MTILVWSAFKICMRLHYCHANTFSTTNVYGSGLLRTPIISVPSAKRSSTSRPKGNRIMIKEGKVRRIEIGLRIREKLMKGSDYRG